MKIHDQASSSKIASASRKSARVHETSDYISVAQMRTLLASSLAARSDRLSRDDLVSTDEAAAMAGTSRVTINDWIGRGRAIGLSQIKRGYRLPRWQFEPRMWEAIPKLSSKLESREGWLILAFLETPLGALGGITPRAAIEQGELDRVLAVAEQEGN
jgi:hypothetical protein